MIRVRRYHDNGDVDEEIDPEEVSECLGQRGALLWVDVERPTAEDVAVLATEFHVHHLAVEDLLEPSLRPRLGRYPDHCLFVVRDVCVHGNRLTSREIDLLFGDGWFISVRKPGDDGTAPLPVGPVLERFERQRNREGATDECFLLYVLLDIVVDRFFEAADELEDLVDHVEEAIFAEGPDVAVSGATEGSITERLYHLRRDLVLFRRVVAPLREALTPLLRRDVAFVGDTAVIHLRDVYDLAVRATDTADSLRDLINGALEAHLSLTSNRMNLVMKRATSWGAILVAPPPSSPGSTA